MQYNKNNNFLINKQPQGINAVAVVAHPDDETIWMGGTILTFKDWNWKIILTTHNENGDRGKQLLAAVNRYKVDYGVTNISYEFMEAMNDEQNYNNINKVEAFANLDKLSLSNSDIIFTHNTDGEYSHGNHRVLGEYFFNKRKKFNIWHFLCSAIQNPKEKQVGRYIETVYLNSTLLTHKYITFQYSYTSEHYLWTGFNDFMRFEFNSGIEQFTKYE